MSYGGLEACSKDYGREFFGGDGLNDVVGLHGFNEEGSLQQPAMIDSRFRRKCSVDLPLPFENTAGTITE